MGRYMSIWFPYLLADRAIRVKPELTGVAFVLIAPLRGRMVIKAPGNAARAKGIQAGMAVADARAILPALEVIDYKEGSTEKLLAAIAEWSLRYTPVAAVDGADGIMLDISGCAHLWGGEASYLNDIIAKLAETGYTAKAAVADTMGTAWALARYGTQTITAPGAQLQALEPLSSAGLRLEPITLERMYKLGLYSIGSFIHMPRTVLRRRFGQYTLNRIAQALGQVTERIESIRPAVVFQSRLPCMEPIRTRTGIDIALKNLLEQLTQELYKKGKGLRKAVFKSYCLDGGIQELEIGTNRPVRNTTHLLKLFEQKIATLKPGLGIELFILEAAIVEDLSVQQESLWSAFGDADESTALSDLLDRIAGRVGAQAIRRYLPAEQYWPERSVKIAGSVFERPDTAWKTDRPRPISLLQKPERIEVTVPVPDYPPMLFIYKGIIHKIRKADGPERIAREWWQDKETQIRDYYQVEDELGARYWLFRSGTYYEGEPEWFIHGFFA